MEINKLKTYWISFASVKEGSLGCCIVHGNDLQEVIDKTKLLGINPGGEAMATQFLCADEDNPVLKKYGENKLISPETLNNDDEFFSYRDAPEDIKELIDEHSDRICEDCNSGNCHHHHN